MSKTKHDDEVAVKEETQGDAATEEAVPGSSAYLAAPTDYPVPGEYTYSQYTASMPPSGEGRKTVVDSLGEPGDLDATTFNLMSLDDHLRGDAPGQQPAVVLSGGLTLEDLRAAMQHFTHERDWDSYHTPRNLLCALVGEVGELAEIFQWRGEVERGLPDFSDEEKNHVAEELADVLLSLVRLSDVCGFDLGQAAINKLQINTHKYPAETVRGSATKYTMYESARSRRPKYDIPSARKHEEETGRKRARERFSEDQVAAMTELAEKAGWSITALTWEERMKFCQDYNVTKERLCNFFNNRKPKEMKRGRSTVIRRAPMPHYDAHYDGAAYQSSGTTPHEETFLKHMNH